MLDRTKEHVKLSLPTVHSTGKGGPSLRLFYINFL
jgi:hypothetical protein